MWPFNSTSRWNERLVQFEKLMEQYFRRNVLDELPSMLNEAVKEYNQWIAGVKTSAETVQESYNEEVARLNSLGDEVESIEAELKNSQREATDAGAVDAYNALVRQHNELVKEYTARAEQMERRRREHDREMEDANSEVERRGRELSRKQAAFKTQLDEYQRWMDRKGPDKFYRDLNQLFAEVQRACRDKADRDRHGHLRDRIRDLRRELGEHARRECEKRDDGLLLLEVTLCGEEPCMMTLDSGSTVTTLTPEMVEATGLEDEVGPEVELRLPAGITIRAPQLLIPELSVCSQSARYVKGVVLKEPMCGVDGSLGLSFLNRFNYSIEGDKPRRLKLTPRSIMLDQVSPLDAEAIPSDKGYDAFICHKTEDRDEADRVFEFLKDAGYQAFYSQVTLAEHGQANFQQAIDEAIENSANMVVIGSSRRQLDEPWVRSEWQMFDGLLRSGRKRGNIVPVLCGRMSVNELPVALSRYHAIHIGEGNWKTELISFLPKRK